MKLIFCYECHDVRKLQHEVVSCKCGKARGYYLIDGLHAHIMGSAIPLGFSNSSLVHAVSNRPKNGMGAKFEAFVIPEKCATVKKVR